MPVVSASQAKIVQRWVTFSHSSPKRPEKREAMAKANGIEKPT